MQIVVQFYSFYDFVYRQPVFMISISKDLFALNCFELGAIQVPF